MRYSEINDCNHSINFDPNHDVLIVYPLINASSPKAINSEHPILSNRYKNGDFTHDLDSIYQSNASSGGDRSLKLNEYSEIFYNILKDMKYCQKVAGRNTNSIIPVKLMIKYVYGESFLDFIIIEEKGIYDKKNGHSFSYEELDKSILKLIYRNKNEHVALALVLFVTSIVIITLFIISGIFHV